MADHFKIFPVGFIRKRENNISIEIDERYRDALFRLDQFSHILLFYWFHKNDSPEKRKTLQVHPRGNRINPLTGVFGTRSPQRPNPVAITVCRILSIKENIIYIDRTDSIDGSPVIDIKPYIPRSDEISGVKVPGWIGK